MKTLLERTAVFLAFLVVSASAELGDTPITRDECTQKGGTVVGDIGNGAIFEPDYVCENSGMAPTHRVVAGPGEPIASEGEVCCGGDTVEEPTCPEERPLTGHSCLKDGFVQGLKCEYSNDDKTSSVQVYTCAGIGWLTTTDNFVTYEGEEEEGGEEEGASDDESSSPKQQLAVVVAATSGLLLASLFV